MDGRIINLVMEILWKYGDFGEEIFITFRILSYRIFCVGFISMPIFFRKSGNWAFFSSFSFLN
jgi:hypothetical protein